jgi:hypothetical protein
MDVEGSGRGPIFLVPLSLEYTCFKRYAEKEAHFDCLILYHKALLYYSKYLTAVEEGRD